jgi:DNA modification methylase
MRALKQSKWDQDFAIRPALDLMLTALANDAAVYVCTSHHLAPVIWQWMREFADFFGWCVWYKPNPMPSLTKRHWTWCAELIPYATRGKHVFNFPVDGHAYNVWTITKTRESDHPTEKPVEVPLHAIRMSTNSDALVADFFLGSGTTMVAAENLARRCYALEIDPGFCAITLERMATAFPKLKIAKVRP